MSRHNRTFAPPIVGGSSLFIIFAVLCLTVFTLLTLSTSLADRRLSDASAKSVSDYYAADLEAEAILASIRSGNVPDGVEQNGNVYSYSCSISPTQALFVEIRFDDGIWTVLRWQSVTSNA